MKHFILTGILFLSDFFTKKHVEEKGVPQLPKKLEKPLSKHIGFTKVHNEGFLLHTLDRKKGLVKGLSGAFSFIFLIFSGKILFGRDPETTGLAKTGIAFLAAGALGNTYDRFARGYVVDFIQIKTFGKKFSRIVFNLADFFLFIGAAVYALSALVGKKR